MKEGGQEWEEKTEVVRQTWPPGEGRFPEHFAEEDRVVAGLSGFSWNTHASYLLLSLATDLSSEAVWTLGSCVSPWELCQDHCANLLEGRQRTFQVGTAQERHAWERLVQVLLLAQHSWALPGVSVSRNIPSQGISVTFLLRTLLATQARSRPTW